MNNQSSPLKVLRHIQMLEQAGTPLVHYCACGRQHQVTTSNFEETDDVITPKRVIQLDCASHYEYLKQLLGATIEMSIKTDGKGVRGYLAQLLANMYTRWLNR